MCVYIMNKHGFFVKDRKNNIGGYADERTYGYR